MRGLPSFVLTLAVLVGSSSAARAESITFTVEVPHCTPPAATVMLRSNRASAMTVQHDALTRVDATHWRGTFDVQTDRGAFRYRYSHGTCEGALCNGIEKDITYTGSGADVADRSVPAGATSVEDMVFIWRDAVRTFDAQGQPTGLRTAAQKVAFCGPFLSVSEDGSEVVISADSYDAGEVVLEYGPTPAYGNRAVSTGRHRNRFRLTNLGPGELVHYRITQGGLAGADQTFRAPPMRGRGGFRFGFIGDTQYYGEDDRRRAKGVIAQMLAFEPHLVLSPGDLVASETGPNGWEQPEMGRFNVFFGYAAELMARAPFMVAMGNHEEDVDYYWDVFEFPKNDFPKLDHYWFKYGNTHFTILYTGVTDGYDLQGILDSQTPWLDGVLAAAARDLEVRFKVIVLHRGPWSQGRNHPTDGQEFYQNRSSSRPSWGELFETHGVDLVLAGHNHNFTLAETRGTRFITSCGGAPTHDLREPMLPTTRLAEKTCSADFFEVGDKTIAFSAVRQDGTAIPADFVLCREAADCEERPNPCAQDEVVAWTCANRECGHSCRREDIAVRADPARLSFTAPRGGSKPPSQAVDVRVEPARAIRLSVRCEGAGFSCAPAEVDAPGTVTVEADPGSLATGTHAGRLLVSSARAATATVSLELVVTSTGTGPGPMPTNRPPTAPVPVSPIDGEQVEPGSIIRLVVANAADADGDPLSYTFEVRTVASEDPVAQLDSVSESPIQTGAFIPRRLLPDPEGYEWRARAIDGRGLAGPWSGPATFNIRVDLENDDADGGCGCGTVRKTPRPRSDHSWAACLLLLAAVLRIRSRHRSGPGGRL